MARLLPPDAKMPALNRNVGELWLGCDLAPVYHPPIVAPYSTSFPFFRVFSPFYRTVCIDGRLLSLPRSLLLLPSL